MSDHEAAPVEHEHGFEMVVNTNPTTVRQARVRYEDVVDLAYPGGRQDPNAMFDVDYEDAASQPHSGSLAEGGQVEVKRHGTEFSVIRSVRS
jgi:Multiubiquitin